MEDPAHGTICISTAHPTLDVLLGVGCSSLFVARGGGPGEGWRVPNSNEARTEESWRTCKHRRQHIDPPYVLPALVTRLIAAAILLQSLHLLSTGMMSTCSPPNG